MTLLPSSRDWSLAARDVRKGLLDWQVWGLLALTDIRQRYTRSRIGQFWITLSMALFVGGIGVVYSALFKQEMSSYLPFLAANYVVWSTLQSIVADATTVFTSSSIYLRQEAMPRTTFVMRLILRNLITFAHNLVIVPFVFLIFAVTPSWTILMAIPGVALLVIAAFPTVMLIGAISTRFRDMPLIIQNLLQVAFFLTPVMWRPEQLGPAGNYVVGLNPFAVYLRIVSEPLYGRIPGVWTYVAAIICTLVLYAIASPFMARFRARIVYWL
ncbi:ABC transporter permease [Chelatococcus reniformis]|uniref:Sugar ABC transporter permease n=1 Tax=Chelatococcus reniformis TaxID=1494448 RepID=A0A916X8F7_9HYPH|nr:ABC transporter permease [Chelatococcus reniformis]GGC51412.1 sugar ABC transporter permease [Chelatococcus reniformis]